MSTPHALAALAVLVAVCAVPPWRLRRLAWLAVQLAWLRLRIWRAGGNRDD